ncbi:hypothetical protein [Acetobacterium sp.]|uniref:hypothetical protein n=1 Tax=Acetobacterium sp. TaxID=1872094 RepID=UPI002F405A68
MDEDTLDAYIRQLLESSPGTDVQITWQGGEDILSYLCSRFRMFFPCIDSSMKIMAKLLRKRSCADEIMNHINLNSTDYRI